LVVRAHEVLTEFRQRLAGTLALALDGAGFVGSLAGASLSLVLGKLFAAGLFALLAVGVLNRFARRRRGDFAGEQPTPIWVPLVCVALSLVETAAIVEGFNVPVRFYQPGFEKANLLLVVGLLLFLFYSQRYVLRRIFAKASTASAL